MISNNKFNNFNFYLTGFVEEKKLLADLISRVIILKEQIKNISWTQLVLKEEEPNESMTHYFEVRLTEDIQEEIIAIDSIYQEFSHLKSVGENCLYGSENNSEYCFRVQISKIDNRIDISGDGIAPGFRKLGLGCKLYRKMLDKFDFICSEDRNLSAYGKLVWNSMRKNEMFYTFYTPVKAYSFTSEKPVIEILNILTVETKYVNLFLWDDNFLEQNRELIMNSDMKRFIS